jgi:peptidoglycan hydrolase-like protein with peptidoglycan-binding domain
MHLTLNGCVSRDNLNLFACFKAQNIENMSLNCQMKKYFDILELDESATIEAVERAYQKLTNAWRPENHQNLPRYRRNAETKLKQINEAYERLKSYLAARPQPAATPRRTEPGVQPMDAAPEPLSPAEPALDFKPVSGPGPTLDSPPWEPEYPMQPDRPISRTRIQKTVQKSLLFGFVAIIAVLGILLLYRVVLRQQSTEPQTPVIEKAQPTVTTSQKPAVPAPSEKAPVQKAQPAPEAEQLQARARASIQKQAPSPAAATPDRIDYQKALSEEVLNPYNQNAARVRRIQKSLMANGYETGPIDGIIGPFTMGALQQFAADHKIGHDHLFAPNIAAAILLYAEVAAEHPDWHRVITGNEFVSWLDSQTHYGTDRIQTLKDSATARQVNDIIELYKLERHMQPD